MNNSGGLVKRGCYFGIFVFLMHKILLLLLKDSFGAVNFGGGFLSALVIMVIFAFIALAFTGVKNAAECLLITVLGAALVVACESALGIVSPFLKVIDIDIYGSKMLAWIGMYSFVFFGCITGCLISFIASLCDKEIKLIPDKTDEVIKSTDRVKISVYTVITAITGLLFLLTPESSLGVLVFSVVQIIVLMFVIPKKRRILMILPLLVFSLGSVVSTKQAHVSLNILITVIMYGVLASGFSLKESLPSFFKRCASAAIVPFMHFLRPIGWNKDRVKIKSNVSIRVLAGILITVPCVAILLSILAKADRAFLEWLADIFGNVLKYINVGTILRAVLASLIALYLAGAVYAMHVYKDKTVVVKEKKTIRCDLVILNIVIGSILFVYSAFGVFQFKYLFAAIGVSSGFDYATYARNGFFELIMLSCVNIVISLIIARVIRGRMGKGALVSKIFSVYLCVITVVLMASSFYRMCMYCAEYGLSIARVYVIVFLVFQLVAVILTVIYILKPAFNICISYILIGFLYYLSMNICPTDSLVAASQVKRYLKGDSEADICYVIKELSADGASELFVLYEDSKTDSETKEMIDDYFKELDKKYEDYNKDWRKFNFSVNRYLELRNK